MIFLSPIKLPFEDPVIIFTLVLVIILLSPIVLRKLRIPSIIGLIIAGIIVGPHGLNLLLRDSSIILFGTVGLLYIMFLAGLEIDMVQLRKSRYKSILFGLLTFSIPQTLGTIIAYHYLNFNLPTSILLASMFASHTLLTYPIISRLRIAKAEAVTVAIGGTLITDTLALLILSVIVQVHKDQITLIFIIKVLLMSVVFGLFVFWVIPKVAKWFFRTFEGESYSHFVFVLAIVFMCAFIAKLAYLEAIIGAFLAGIVLKDLIPENSALMNRLQLVGNTLFIPFFLIGTGMIVDLKVLFLEPSSLKVALVMVVIATTAKWLAAYITQQILGYSVSERNIIFGLSNSQAAATLAAVTIGYELGIFDDNVLNGTILMIIVTCFIASFATESGARKLAVAEEKQIDDKSEEHQRIMVPISNPQTIEKLMDLAILIKDPIMVDPIYPLTIVKDDEDVDRQVQQSKKMLEHAVKHASATGTTVQLVTRVDLNIPSGIIRAMKELQITTLIIGWNAKMTAREKIFGSVLDNILLNSIQTLFVCKLLYSVSTFQRLRVFMPPLAHFEPGFINWLQMIKILTQQAGTSLEMTGSPATLEHLRKFLPEKKPFVSPVMIADEEIPNLNSLAKAAQSGDIFIFVSARRTNISYQNYLDDIPFLLSKYFETASFIVVYPEQTSKGTYESSLQLDEHSVFPLQENITRLNRLIGGIKSFFRFNKKPY